MLYHTKEDLLNDQKNSFVIKEYTLERGSFDAVVFPL